jgi:hypothetical protein
MKPVRLPAPIPVLPEDANLRERMGHVKACLPLRYAVECALFLDMEKRNVQTDTVFAPGLGLLTLTLEKAGATLLVTWKDVESVSLLPPE